MTLNQLRTLLRENGVEYTVKRSDSAVAIIHVLLDKEEEINVTS
jgi:hypothetical protein